MIVKGIRCICDGQVDKESEAGPLRCVACGMVALLDCQGLVFTLSTARSVRESLKKGVLLWGYLEQERASQ